MFNLKDTFRTLLEKDYLDYVNSVTTPEMAASLECTLFLLELCGDISPRSVIDFGSGFSSFALRKYREEYNSIFTITSVDTDENWLIKTKQFIESKNIDNSNIITFDKFMEKPRNYDLILYDVAYYQNGTRQQLLPIVLQNCVHNKTNILFDDMHIQHYFMFVLHIMSGLKFNMINAKPYTLDNYGRFSMLFNNIDNI